MRLLRSRRSWLALLPLIAFIPSVQGGDISPLKLPSTGQFTNVRPPAVVTTERLQYYDDFRRDMARATPERRKILAAGFQKRRDASLNADERNHYERLLQILAEFK